MRSIAMRRRSSSRSVSLSGPDRRGRALCALRRVGDDRGAVPDQCRQGVESLLEPRCLRGPRRISCGRLGGEACQPLAELLRELFAECGEARVRVRTRCVLERDDSLCHGLQRRGQLGPGGGEREAELLESGAVARRGRVGCELVHTGSHHREPGGELRIACRP